MSSKLTVKQSKKDRPKSSDKLKGKKRDGTPDKTTTTPNPSQDLLEEHSLPMKNVIYNEEIASLQIKEEDLAKIREPRPPSTDRKCPAPQQYTVRKLKPVSEWDLPKPKTIHVLKQAPPDAPVKPIDLSNIGGPRLDAEGEVVSHSILGNVDEFMHEAVKRGHVENIPLPQSQASSESQLTVKYEKKKKVQLRAAPPMLNMNESNALKNWRAKMLERKRQQGYISRLLQKPAESLVMNRGDSYRKVEEERYLIDRTIPAIDYGKGYRVGSEFWNQQECIGDDLTGIHMTLRQTDKGYPPPIEHVGVPITVKEEKGIDWESRCSTPINHPWNKSRSWSKSVYRDVRLDQLKPIINEMDPHKPVMKRLEIVGNQNTSESSSIWHQSTSRQTADVPEVNNICDPLSDHPDVHPFPFIGPSLLFDNQEAQWIGDGFSNKDQLGIEARVMFEAYSGERAHSYLDIVNNGTTTIYYDWKSIEKTNPFDIVNAKVQRFYFDTSPGVILPGDSLKFPFIFKSPNAGVFTEQWQFQTKPVVCGGASLIVTLRGIALQEDKYKEKRIELETELAGKQATQVVSHILDELLDGIKTPERSRSPVDAYITDAEIFERQNPGRYFSHETIESLHVLYHELIPEEEHESQQWNLDLNTLEDMIVDLDEEDERKEDLLQRLNMSILTVSFPPFNPVQQQMYNVGYRYLSDAIDTMVGQSMRLRKTMGLPDHEDIITEEPSRAGSESPAESVLSQESHLSASKQPEQPAKTDSKKGGKKDVKSTTKTAPKDAKPAKGKETSVKDAQKGAKTPTKPTSRAGTSAGLRNVDPERPGSQSSHIGSPIPEENQQEVKYREKLYLQTYALICDSVKQMNNVFDEIKSRDDVSN
ncbi:MYCBP-associated protein-like isoform X3 [Tubulanus polymorphus]|uniref:MYCBP-associated protein-like isoform X3 n=1 Tax=Tubulanus polymorphus TaxID=672921 RepID=UPI003DA51393